MNKKFLMFSIICLINHLAFAVPIDSLPDELNVITHGQTPSLPKLGPDYTVETSNQRILSIENHGSVYTWYTSQENGQIYVDNSASDIVKLSFKQGGMYGNLIGTVEEKVSYFPSFTIYDNSDSTKLAYGTMNFWGTKYTVYDPTTDQEMVVMSRALFDLDSKRTIKITNPSLIKQNNLNPIVLMSVLTLQYELNEWKKSANSRVSLQKSTSSDDDIDATRSRLLDQLNTLEKVQNIATHNIALNHEKLEATANELQSNFDKTHFQNDNYLTPQEKFSQFTNYCIAQIQSPTVANDKKQAIITLLKMRLGTK